MISHCSCDTLPYNVYLAKSTLSSVVVRFPNQKVTIVELLNKMWPLSMKYFTSALTGCRETGGLP